MLELHVYGPLSSLPSLDPLCLSAIAFLNISLPRTLWTVIASSNPSLSPSNSLPALRDTTTNTWHSSLPAIIEFVTQAYDPPIDTRDPRDLAWTAFITSTASPAVDLSLWISESNYTAVVRRTFTHLAGFPDRWILPTQLRSAARTRTSHLHLTPSNLDSPAQDDTGFKTAAEIAAQSAQPPKIDVRGQLTTSNRLAKVYDALLAPLLAQLGSNRFLLGGDAPTVADCVALGYLSLLLVPDMPSGFARAAVTGRYERLAAYVHDLKPKLLGAAIEDVEAVLRGEEGGLPWGRVERGDLRWLGGVYWGAVRNFGKVVTDEDDGEGEEGAEEKKEGGKRAEWWGSVAAVLGGIGLFVGYAVWAGILRIQESEEEEEEEEEEEKGVDGGMGDVVEEMEGVDALDILRPFASGGGGGSTLPDENEEGGDDGDDDDEEDEDEGDEE